MEAAVSIALGAWFSFMGIVACIRVFGDFDDTNGEGRAGR